jgi:tetratricopeptide (TPR) repeat protein
VPLILALLFLTWPAAAQTPDSYTSIIEQYLAGDGVGAVKQLAPRGGRLPGEVVARVRALSDRQVRGAVMMHTELADAWLLIGQPSSASIQIGNAERLLRILTEDVGRRSASQSFAIRWYAFVTSVYSAQGLFDLAHRMVTAGLTTFPRSAELMVAEGCVFEMRASLVVSTRNQRTVRDPSRENRQFASLLDAAAKDFTRALDADATLAAAHLHRGWVHHLLDDGRAPAELEAALGHATDDGSRYLAHLFLGAVAEQRKDLDTARREYEAAKAIGPYQTPYVALGRIEEQSGHGERARSIAADYARLPDKVEDPWWDYRLGGFITGALAWLRREAGQP